MNVLEKILEEIEKAEEDYIYEEHSPMYAMGACSMAADTKDIIRSHINEERDKHRWIPVEERLPKEHETTFTKLKGTDKWSSAMWEKMSDKVNVTYELEDGTRKTGTSYTLDGAWEMEEKHHIVKTKVIAWQPLPEPYHTPAVED